MRFSIEHDKMTWRHCWYFPYDRGTRLFTSLCCVLAYHPYPLFLDIRDLVSI